MIKSIMVRRMDDLGRIVLPMEIRKALKVKPGDPFEIHYGANGTVILKPKEVDYCRLLSYLRSIIEIGATAIYNKNGDLQVESKTGFFPPSIKEVSEDLILHIGEDVGYFVCSYPMTKEQKILTVKITEVFVNEE